MNFRTLAGALRLARARLAGRRAFATMRAHCEKYFPAAVTIRPIAPEIGIEIVKSDGVAAEGLVTYMTRGLSRYPLPTREPAGGRKAQELAITVAETCALPIEEVLESVAKSCLYRFQAMRPGMAYEFSFAVEFGNPALTIAGVFASSQVWLDPEVLQVAELGDVEVSIIELAPITAEELELVRADVSEFISRTVDGRIDLLDFQR